MPLRTRANKTATHPEATRPDYSNTLEKDINDTGKKPGNSTSSNSKGVTLYLVSNQLGLDALDITLVARTLGATLNTIYDVPPKLRITRKINPDRLARYVPHESRLYASYPTAPQQQTDTTETPQSLLAFTTGTPIIADAENDTPTRFTILTKDRAWDPDSFLYTDGSKKQGNPVLGAAVISPRHTKHTTRIKVTSDPIRHTINRAELAAIAVAIAENQTAPTLSILTDSSCSINLIRNYAAEPSKMTEHLHRELLSTIDEMLQDRDLRGFQTHIGKVKSHTGIKYNDEADEAAKDVVDDTHTPDVTFSDGGRQQMGLRTWPEVPGGPPPPENDAQADETEIIMEPLSNLNTALKKQVSSAKLTTGHRRTKHGYLMRKAIEDGADHTVHSRTLSTNRQTNYALEIAWGVHNTRLRASNKKPRGPLLCRVCKKYLSNSHLAGDCHVHQNMRTRRHNSTFTLLKKLVESSEGGRWPIITSDLGRRPVHEFHEESPKEIAMHTDPPPATSANRHTAMPTTRRSTIEEGMEDTFKVTNSNIIPEAILPRHKLPTHHKPDNIRYVGFDLSESGKHLHPAKDCREVDRQMEIIEYKASTDYNMKEVEANAHATYIPLANAIKAHGAWKHPVIIRIIVFSRTGSTTQRTIAHIHAITTPPPPQSRRKNPPHNIKHEPPDKMTFKQAPKTTQNIIIKVHHHLQQWLEAILIAARRDLSPSG